MKRIITLYMRGAIALITLAALCAAVPSYAMDTTEDSSAKRAEAVTVDTQEPRDYLVFCTACFKKVCTSSALNCFNRNANHKCDPSKFDFDPDKYEICTLPNEHGKQCHHILRKNTPKLNQHINEYHPSLNRNASGIRAENITKKRGTKRKKSARRDRDSDTDTDTQSKKIRKRSAPKKKQSQKIIDAAPTLSAPHALVSSGLPAPAPSSHDSSSYAQPAAEPVAIAASSSSSAASIASAPLTPADDHTEQALSLHIVDTPDDAFELVPQSNPENVQAEDNHDDRLFNASLGTLLADYTEHHEDNPDNGTPLSLSLPMPPGEE